MVPSHVDHDIPAICGLVTFFAPRYQQRYKMEAMRGMGVDRHLFGLYVVAKGMKMDPMPKMFTDKVSEVEGI